jgi:transposase
MTEPTPNGATVPIGVGIDTARYGHHVTFLDMTLQDVAKPFDFRESREGHDQLRKTLEQLVERFPNAHFHIRLDVAGQYATNLEGFLHGLPVPKTISTGEPDRNRKYREVHFPKRKADGVESRCAARFALVEKPKGALVIPSEILELREIVSRLESQTRQVTRFTNQLRGLLARTFPELALLAQNFQARWLLDLLHKYPTPQRIAQARLASLEKIPYLSQDRAKRIQAAALLTVGSLKGETAEELVRGLVAQLWSAIQLEDKLHDLMVKQYESLEEPNLLSTIPGIGSGTAAVLTAKMIVIARFLTPDAVVGCFGVFAEEDSSGLDRDGKPKTGRKKHMSRKGNDLVRKYLWNAAKSAIRHNPAVRALYVRLRKRGLRGDVALGHCMRKLLHLVFAIWSTGKPFDENHYDWTNTTHVDSNVADTNLTVGDTPPQTSAEGQVPRAKPAESPKVARPTSGSNKKATGHTQDRSPARKVVTAANSKVAIQDDAVKQTDPPLGTPNPNYLDYAALRGQITMATVLKHLGHLSKLKGSGSQRRGCCPVHGTADGHGRSFSVNLDKNVFQCFHPPCAIHGNALDLWAAVRQLPLREAAEDLARTFNLTLSSPDATEKRNPSSEHVHPKTRKEPAHR